MSDAITHYYLFLDLETTGLSPVDDDILEIAWCLTDSEFQPIENRSGAALVQQEDFGSTFVKLQQANDVVREMHNRSGLAGELLTAKDGFVTLDNIADRLRWVAAGSHVALDSQVHLAGSSVHFDKSFMQAQDEFYHFIEEHGPLHHRIFDLSAIKLLWESAGVPLPDVVNTNPHRALHDVHTDVLMAQAIRSQLISYFGADIMLEESGSL